MELLTNTIEKKTKLTQDNRAGLFHRTHALRYQLNAHRLFQKYHQNYVFISDSIISVSDMSWISPVISFFPHSLAVCLCVHTRKQLEKPVNDVNRREIGEEINLFEYINTNNNVFHVYVWNWARPNDGIELTQPVCFVEPFKAHVAHDWIGKIFSTFNFYEM